jgi:hypothetical protein
MSERSLTTAFKTEAAANTCRPAFLVLADFPSAPVRLWTGTGSVTWSGDSYTGAGHLLALEPPTETKDGSSQGMSATLSGIPTGTLSDIIDDAYQGRSFKSWFAFIDSGGSVVGDPFLVFGGGLDADRISDDGQTGQVTINAENRLVDQLKPRSFRTTHEDQKLLHTTTDLGFEFVEVIQNLEIPWGRSV